MAESPEDLTHLEKNDGVGSIEDRDLSNFVVHESRICDLNSVSS